MTSRLRIWLDADWYNFRTALANRIVSILRIRPRCPCGWPLAQRNDGLWVCGACTNAGRGYYDEVAGQWRRR
jgi:hypothetical protein